MSWIEEVDEMSGIVRIGLAMQLATVPGKDKEFDRAHERLDTF